MTRDEALKLRYGGPTAVGEWNRRCEEMDAYPDFSDANRIPLGDAVLRVRVRYVQAAAGAEGSISGR